MKLAATFIAGIVAGAAAVLAWWIYIDWIDLQVNTELEVDR